MNIQKSIALVVCLAIGNQAFAGIGSNKAAYRGGTVAGIKEGTEAALNLGADAATFEAKKAGAIRIPYATVDSLEYGQKAGRRVGATIGWGVTTLGVAALPILLSKKRKHYLTIAWKENGADQAVVFELGKDAVRPTLAALKARTGKAIEFQDKDARQQFSGN